MDIIRKMIKNLSDSDKNDIYLREIALLMEEIDLLKARLGEKEKLLKNYEKQIRGKKS